MVVYVFVVLWCALSFPNYFIFRKASFRIRRALGSPVPVRPMDAGDYFLLALLVPFGLAGSLLGAFMTEWWCSGLEDGGAHNADKTSKRKSGSPRLLEPAITVNSKSWTG